MWLLFLILNLAISWANAWVAGTTWYEADRGWPWLVKWSTAIMSAIGFTWCLLQVIVRVAGQWMPGNVAEMSITLGYLVILPALLLTGLVITIESVRQAVRTRRLGDTVVATYNTTAVVHNALEAVEFLPSLLLEFGDSVGDSLTEADDPVDFLVGGLFFGMIWLALFVVTIALGSGVLLTKLIIQRQQKKTIANRIWRVRSQPSRA